MAMHDFQIWCTQTGNSGANVNHKELEKVLDKIATEKKLFSDDAPDQQSESADCSSGSIEENYFCTAFNEAKWWERLRKHVTIFNGAHNGACLHNLP